MNDDPEPVALVTAVRRGIGRRWSSICSTADTGLWAAAAEIRTGGAEGFHLLRTDDESRFESLFREIKRRYRRLDAAINNAAVTSMNHVLLTPATSVAKMMSANVVGTFLVGREAAQLMRKHGSWRIVNFSLLAAPMRLGGQSAYVASRAAVEILSQVMARALAEYGITVNVIGPSPSIPTG